MLEEYTQSVLKHGVMPDVRGKAIAVPRMTSDVGGPQTYWLLGHATLVEARLRFAIRSMLAITVDRCEVVWPCV